MATPTTYRDITFVTVIPSVTVNATIPRGSRVVLYPADGTDYVTLAGGAVRGDFITAGDAAAGFPIAAANISRGGEFYGIVATGVTGNAGDALYSAANGQITNVATGAAYLGKAREAYTAGNYVGITLQSVA